MLEVGSKTLFEKFEDSLIGMKKGEEKNIVLTLPDDIEDDKLAGRKANFEILIKEIKSKVLPEIDEEFLKNMGDYKDIDEFRNYIKDKLIQQKRVVRRNKIIGDIFNYLMENTKVDIPHVMINNRISIIKEEFNRMLKEQKISKKNYLKALNITEEKFNEEIRQRAVSEIKEYLIITALEKTEKDNIEPTPDEIKKEKEDLLSRNQKEEDKNKIKEFIESPDGEKNMVASIRRRKLIDFLIRNAKITEEEKKDVSRNMKERLLLPEKDESKIKNLGKKIWTPG